MRTKVTLVLLLLNVVLFFVIFRVERAWRTESVAMEVRRRVLGAEAADIRSLAVAGGPGGVSYRLEQRAGAWYLTRPWVWRANANAVSGIIHDLQFLDDETSFSVAEVERNGQQLSDYGLDPAVLTVSIASGGADTTGGPATETTLRIGAATKVGRRLYVLSPDGRRIHVVSAGLLESLTLPLDRLRADAVLTIPFYEARALNLQMPSGSRVLIEREDAGWTFETPISARASRSDLELMVNQLDGLRATRFEPGAPEALPGGSVRVTVEGDNRRETLFLGTEPDAGGAVTAELENPSPAGGRSVPFRVRVPEPLRSILTDPVDRLRDQHILADLDPDAVSAIALRAPGRPEVQLQRLEPGGAAPGSPGGGWEILLPSRAGQPPRPIRADADAVHTLLAELAGLSAEKFVSDAPSEADLENWGFNRPERTIALTQPAPRGGGAPGALTLEIARAGAKDALALARLANAPSVYGVDPEILRDASVEPRDWRDRQLRPPDAAQVSALALVDLSTGTPRWSWTASDPGSGPGPALAAAVLRLRARRFVADHFDPAGAEGRPWRYRLDATLMLPGGAAAETRKVHALYLQGRTGGTEQIAGSAEYDAVFVPEQRLIDELWTVVYGSRDPGPPR